ncbi:MAG: GTPase [Clostridia bacterium]|nr:GTPase [Lachnospiraceae bacterium]MBQ7094200.1 GTPase [Clostridia bacterium]
MNEKRNVYIIYGFLESGKSQFINFTVSQDYFKQDEPTLIIQCEEGEVEYDETELKSLNTYLETVEEYDEFNPEKLEELAKKYDADRIIIEYNGMWNAKDIEERMPLDWAIRQQITIIDGVTFETYVANMRSLFAEMIRNSEMCIMNRCHDVDKLNGYKRTIKSLNTGIETVFEDEEGEIDLPLTDEDLPYDLKADLVEIKPEDYGIFYLDVWDNPDRYAGKRFHIQTLVMKEPRLPKNFFVAGRPAMTCCADDLVFMGLICKSKEAKNLVDKNTVDMIVSIVKEYRSDYGGEGPVLYAESCVKTAPMKDPVVNMV